MKFKRDQPAIWAALISAIGIIIAAFIGIVPLITFSKSELPLNEESIVLTANSSRHIASPFDVPTYYYPGGWMGDGELGKKYIELDTAYRGKTRNNDEDGLCIKVSYIPGIMGWAGIFWQYPDHNWGESPGRFIDGATKVTFWAAGEKGGEIVEFKAGGIFNSKKKYQDSFEVSLGRVKLSESWQYYEINLEGKELSNVIGAFSWVATRNANPKGLTFYIDEIRYE